MQLPALRSSLVSQTRQEGAVSGDGRVSIPPFLCIRGQGLGAPALRLCVLALSSCAAAAPFGVFVGEVCFPIATLVLKMLTQTPGQLTSAFPRSSSPLGPAARPAGYCGCGLTSDGGGGRARPELLGQLLPLLSGLCVYERLRVPLPSSPTQSQDRGRGTQAVTGL